MRKVAYKYGLILSKGQGQVKQGHQMKMLHERRVTHVLWATWDIAFDGGIHVLSDPKKGQGQIKLRQI